MSASRRELGKETYDIPMIVPPPNPLKARQMISLASAIDLSEKENRQAHQVIFFDAPHKAEKMTKSKIAMYSNGLRPTMSDTRPLTGARRVMAKVYDFIRQYTHLVEGDGQLTVPTQEYSDGEAFNSSDICGRAVATIWAQRRANRPHT